MEYDLRGRCQDSFAINISVKQYLKIDKLIKRIDSYEFITSLYTGIKTRCTKLDS